MVQTSAKFPQLNLNASWFFIISGLIAGAVHALASSWLGPFGLSGFFSLLALVLLAALIAKASFWQAVLAGGSFALAWLCGSVWWLYISMHQYGGMPSVIAALAVFLLCAGLSLIYAIAAGLTRKASPAKTVCAVSFAAAWLLAEMMRGWIFTGFPWAASGYAHVDSIFNAYAPWLGVYGVGAVVALVAASIMTIGQYIFTYRRPQKTLKKIHAIMTAGIIVIAIGASWPLRYDFTTSAGELKVALLQGNVPQDLKFDAQVASQSFAWYFNAMQQAKKQGAQLVLMPETAIPYFPETLPAEVWSQFNAVFTSGEMAALIGIPLIDENRNITNSMLSLAVGQERYQYDKYHLVPFGEFIPWGFHWFVNMMEIPLGDLRRGSIDASSFSWQGQLIAPNICYEDLFGEELARRFNDPQQEPTIMANASNIAWFGDTVAIPQHLQIARMRSLEFQRPMIRATNTGATAIVDYHGRVDAMLAPYTQGVLMGRVNGRRGLTPFVWWAGKWGLAPLWGIGIITLVFALVLRRKKA